MLGDPQLITSVGYNEPNDTKMVQDFHHQASEILEKSGIKDIFMYDTKQSPRLDIHEMGGVRMGKDPKTSICSMLIINYIIAKMYL
jgi:choline dehydrogenase-like flavoprotein